MSRPIVAEAGRPVSTDGSAAGGSEEGARGNVFRWDDRWRRAVAIADKASEERMLSLLCVNDIDWHALCTTESTRTCGDVAT